MAATDLHEESLSTPHLLLAHSGAALALFLATTDATILSTSLPTITRSLNASNAEYTWILVAYLLTQTAFQPVYGKLSDILGHKLLCHLSIGIFAIGSLLCGLAQTGPWLIAARALAGIGSGGIVPCVWVMTAEIVPLHSRAKWSQALSLTWSCSAIAGPLLGGVFSSGTLGWRWSFLINLPICGAASLLLFWSLRHVRLARTSRPSIYDIARTFDFAGLALFMSASCALVLGFNLASSWGWSSPTIIGLITGSLVMFVCGACYELRTRREAIFPPAIFCDINLVLTLITVFLHNFAFNAGTFYISLFYQAVGGRSPMQAGLQLLPYSLGASVASMPIAWIIQAMQQRHHNTRSQKWVMIIGLMIATVGFGLLSTLKMTSPIATQAAVALTAGIGIGMLFHAPYQVFAARLPSKLASGTSAFFLVRFTGAIIGLSVAGNAFDSRLADVELLRGSLAQYVRSSGWNKLYDIQPPAVQQEALQDVVEALQMVWIICASCLGVAAILSMFIRVQSLAAVTPAEGAATVTTTEAIIVSSEEDAEKTLSETLDA